MAEARAPVKDKTDKDITVRHLVSVGMKVSSVKKKLKEKAFAPGLDKEEVYGAEETLGLALDEFIAVAIEGIQQVAPDIGL